MSLISTNFPSVFLLTHPRLVNWSSELPSCFLVCSTHKYYLFTMTSSDPRNRSDQRPQIESTSLQRHIPLLAILIVFPKAFLNPFIPLSLPLPSSLSLVVRLWQGFINLLLREVTEVKLRMFPHPSHLTCCYGCVRWSQETHAHCTRAAFFSLCSQLLTEMCCIGHAAFMLLKTQCVTVRMEPPRDFMLKTVWSLEAQGVEPFEGNVVV